MQFLICQKKKKDLSADSKSCSKCGFNLFSFERIIVEMSPMGFYHVLFKECVFASGTERQGEKDKHRNGERQGIKK